MSDVADYSRGEPAPVPNDNPSIHDLVITDIINEPITANCDERALATKLILERKEFGYKKYGTILQAHNGRNSLSDAVDEGLDLLVYVRQWLEENKEKHVLPEIYGRMSSIYISLLEEVVELVVMKDGE